MDSEFKSSLVTEILSVLGEIRIFEAKQAVKAMSAENFTAALYWSDLAAEMCESTEDEDGTDNALWVSNEIAENFECD